MYHSTMRNHRIVQLVLLALAITACKRAPRSAAADVPAEDLRRLSPAKKQALTDHLSAQADKGRILGGDSATVQVFVISDYQSAASRTWFETQLPPLRAAYVDSGKVRLLWVHYPLREHPRAVRAASAAMCASAKGKFWEASARLFATQAKWSAATDTAAGIDSAAFAPGLVDYEFKDCVDSRRMLRRIRGDIDWADTVRAGAPPMIVVGTRHVPGSAPFATLRAVIDSALAGR